MRAARSCCSFVAVAVEEGNATIMVAGGLPKIMGTNEDATDDGTPAEVVRLKIDEVSSSGPEGALSEVVGVV